MRREWIWSNPLPSADEAIDGAKRGDIEMAHEAAFQFVEEVKADDSASDPTQEVAAAVRRLLLDRQHSTLDVPPDTLQAFLDEEHSPLAAYVAERLAEEGHKFTPPPRFSA